MTDLQITVTKKQMRLSGTPVIVCGNSDYTIQFKFDAAWEAYTTKTARFAYYQDGVFRYADIQFEGDCVSVPLLYDTDAVAVGVYAGDICTTVPVLIPCARCITDGSGAADIPAEDVYNELMEELAGEPGWYLLTADAAYLMTLTEDFIMAKE